MSLTIRKATVDDEDEIAALWKACDLVTSHNNPGADFRFALGGASSEVLAGVDASGRICGSVLVGHDGHRGWIWYVAAHPQRRKQGIGKRMVAAGEDWLRTAGVRKVMLLVRDTNLPVVEFYQHIGYRDVPRVVMEKWLSTCS